MASLVLGFPDFGAAYHLIRNGYPQQAGMLAIGEIMVWASVFAIGIVTVAATVRGTRSIPARAMPGGRRASWVIVALGAACLAVGAARHATAGYSPCCGSPQQAEQALEAAP